MSEPLADLLPFPWHREELARFLSDRARLPHAVLVHGPRGIGKAQFVRAMGAALLCESPREGLACGACASCHWFSQGNHPDYREVVPAAQAPEEDEEAAAEGGRGEARKSIVIKIEQIRALADFISLSTHRAGYRFLAIRPAEALHPSAANALLKTLEEPPASTLIALAADQPARILPTIRSRCRPVPLRIPAPEAALAWLRAEQVPDAEAALAAAGGAPLLASDLADPAKGDFRRRVVAELSRTAGADPLAFGATVDRDALEGLIHWMQTWTHDLVAARMGAAPRHHVDAAKALFAHARHADLDRLFDLERELLEARALAAHPLNPRLVAEHLLMAYNRAILRGRP